MQPASNDASSSSKSNPPVVAATAAGAASRASTKVRDAVAQREELFRAEGFREEVGHVVRSRDEGHHDLQVLNALADGEVAPLHGVSAQGLKR